MQYYFSQHDIIHQCTCVGNPQQKSIAERKHRHILEVPRALRFQAYLPISLWGECSLTATYLINRIPTPNLSRKTPYEMLFNIQPTDDHLCEFGCLCYAHSHAPHRHKFEPRASRCIFKGHTIYLTIIRLDITFFVHYLIQFMQAAYQPHYDAAIRILRYLKSTPGKGIFLPSNSSLQIATFCDSDCVACPTTRCSVRDYFTLLGNSPLSWKSKKQSTVSRSSVEAKYPSMVSATCELIWLKALLHDLDLFLILTLGASTVIIKLLFTLPPTLSTMNEPNTLRSIVTWFVSAFSPVSLLPYMFLLNNN